MGSGFSKWLLNLTIFVLKTINFMKDLDTKTFLIKKFLMVKKLDDINIVFTFPKHSQYPN